MACTVKLRKPGVLSSASVKHRLREELGDIWQGSGSAGDYCTLGPPASFSLLRVVVRCSSPVSPFLVQKICRNIVFLMNFNPSAVISVDSEVEEGEYREAEDHHVKLSFYSDFLKSQLC